MARICIHCKRVHQNFEECPFELAYREVFSAKNVTTDHIDGAAPNIFVGRYGYPKVAVGFLAPPNVHEAELFDAPRTWSKGNFEIPDIATLRRTLVQSKFITGVQETSKTLDMAQEVAMSIKPVDVDIALHNKPKELSSFDGVSAPFGPSASLKKVHTDNPKIPKSIDKAVSDTDLTATKALGELHKKNFDEQQLTKLLSLGTLGKGTNRRLVPTRWAITATDDSLGKHLLEQIQDYKQAEYQLYFGGYLGNYYLIIFFSSVFRYELFESYIGDPQLIQPGETFPTATDYESASGRKSYAQQTAGGYYAARYPILERLHKTKQQASVLALRFITKEYTAPLGVWVVREATRKALASAPIMASSRKDALEKASTLLKNKLGVSMGSYIQQSKLLKEIKEQTSLQSFFS